MLAAHKIVDADFQIEEERSCQRHGTFQNANTLTRCSRRRAFFWWRFRAVHVHLPSLYLSMSARSSLEISAWKSNVKTAVPIIDDFCARLILSNMAPPTASNYNLYEKPAVSDGQTS